MSSVCTDAHMKKKTDDDQSLSMKALFRVNRSSANISIYLPLRHIYVYETELSIVVILLLLLLLLLFGNSQKYHKLVLNLSKGSEESFSV